MCEDVTPKTKTNPNSQNQPTRKSKAQDLCKVACKSAFCLQFFVYIFSAVCLHISRATSLPPSYYSSCNGYGGASSNNFNFSTNSLPRMLSRSPEWNQIPNKEKDKLGLTVKDDGEFW